ncbi:MAG: helix-turn-helix domain-containing protein [bacterium]
MGAIGEKLRNARLAKGVTPSQAAAATRIKMQIIEDMENDDFSSISAPIYCRGFIKIYAEYLGLDSTPLITTYKEQFGPPPAPTLGKDTGCVVEHPDRSGEPATVEPEKEPLSKFEWSRLNIFREFSIPTEPAHLKAMIVEEPLKFALLGLGLLVVLVFIVSGLRQCAQPSVPSPAGKGKGWDTSRIGNELPAPYVDSDR